MARILHSYFKPKSYILLVIIPGLLFISSCSHDDGLTFPVKKSFTDPNQYAVEFNQLVKPSGDGWNGTFETSNGRIFKLFLAFEADGLVKVFTDHDSLSSCVAKTSQYRVEVLQNTNATLIFDKGSNLDLMGEAIDKEFVIIKMSGDSVRLTGSEFSTSLILTKAIPADSKQFSAGALARNISEIGTYMETAKYLNSQVGPGKITQMVISTSSRGVLFTYVENEMLKYEGSNFYYTDKGIYLKKPITIQGSVVKEIFWDTNTNGMFILINGVRNDIMGTSLPIIPLHYMIGIDYPSLLEFPPNLGGVDQPGWSDQFLYVWDYDKIDLYNKKYWILLGLQLSMNVTSNTMNLDFYYVGDDSKTVLKGRFPYAFTKSLDGIYKFTPLALGTDADGNNALAIQPNLAKTLSTFNNNTFHIELYDAIAELNTLLPQFKSVEDSDIFFTGRFLK